MSIINRLPAVRGSYRENVHISRMCWFGVGGEVAAFYQPADTDDLAHFIANKPADIPHFVFGVGSNIIVLDKGFPGVAIRLGREFNFVKKIGGDILNVGAYTLDLNVAIAAAEYSIGGLEFLSGVPGTIGGALFMNAGCYGREIKDVLVTAIAVSPKGQILQLTNEEFGFKYRSNSLTDGYIFTECILKGYSSEQDEITALIMQYQNQRKETQPIKTKTGGSTFKNPPEQKAWQLIDKAGCRGLKIGGAQVSEMHCNFFINTGDATASDLLQLIQTVQEKVFITSGVKLEVEIKIIG